MKKILTILTFTILMAIMLPTGVKADDCGDRVKIVDVNQKDTVGFLAEDIYGDIKTEGVVRVSELTDFDSYGSDYIYEKLNSAGKKLWDDIEEVCNKAYSSSEDFKKYGDYYPIGYVNYEGLTVDEATNIALYYYYSNPQHFYLIGAVLRAKLGTEDNRGIISLCCYQGFEKGSARATARTKFERKLSAWTKEVESQNDIIAKEKKAHDLIVNNTAYVSGSQYNQSAYSNMVNGKAVCAGYAKSFSLLMNHAGLKTFSITSNYHEWNLILIAGSWYNVDCTWDDPLTYSGEQVLRYNYFNRSDRKVSENDSNGYNEHKRRSMWDGIAPSCTKDSGATDDDIGNTPIHETYTVTLSANGGYIEKSTVKSKKITVTYGKPYGTLAKPSRVGYKFLGWYTAKTGGTKIISTTKVTTKKNHTLYAHWKKISLGKGKVIKIVKVSKGACKVTVGRVADATGYQLEYALNGKFTSSKRKYMTSLTTKLTGLTKGKTYYFRVRAYVKDSAGRKVYGAFSTSMKYKVS